MAPIVDDAALLLVVMVIAPVVSMLACRLFAASAVLSWLRVEIWPVPVPKVMAGRCAAAGGGDGQGFAESRRRRAAGVGRRMPVEPPVAVPVTALMRRWRTYPLSPK